MFFITKENVNECEWTWNGLHIIKDDSPLCKHASLSKVHLFPFTYIHVFGITKVSSGAYVEI